MSSNFEEETLAEAEAFAKASAGDYGRQNGWCQQLAVEKRNVLIRIWCNAPVAGSPVGPTWVFTGARTRADLSSELQELLQLVASRVWTIKC